MTQTIRKNLNDHAWARWTAMALIALMMLFAHMFVDVISPLKELIQLQRGWTSDVFGTYAGSEYLLNVWGFLIVAGIILDKMGIRFTGVTSALVMIAFLVIHANTKQKKYSPWYIAAFASILIFPDLNSIQEAFPRVDPKLVGDDMAYPALIQIVPNGWMGLVVVSLMGALFSTIAAQLSMGANYVTNDIWKRFIRKDASDKELILVAQETTMYPQQLVWTGTY